MPRPRRTYDIVLNGQGFMLSSARGQDRSIASSFVPSSLEASQQVATRDIPIIYDDFSGGMGYSERLVGGTYAYGRNVRTRDPRVVLPGPKLNNVALPVSTGSGGNLTSSKGPIKAIVEHAGDLYFFGGGVPWKSITGDPGSMTVEYTNSPTNSAGLGTTFAAESAVVFRPAGSPSNTKDLYISGTGGFFWRKRGAVWTQYSGTPTANQPSMKFGDMVVVYQVVRGAQGYRIVGVDANDPAKIWSVQGDPMSPSNWANAGTVEGGYPVRSLAASNRHVYYVTDIGVYDLTEAGYSPHLTPYWKDSRSELNGLASIVFGGMVFAAHSQGLDMVDVSQGLRQDFASWAWPKMGVPNNTPILGTVTALTTESGYLVMALYNPYVNAAKLLPSSFVLYGLPVNSGSGPDLVWHGAEICIPYEKITAMAVNTLTGSPKLWIATQVTSNLGGKTVGDIQLYYCTIPNASSALQDWEHGGAHRFAESWELDLPSEDYMDSASRKTIMRYEMQADNLGISFNTPVQIQVKARSESSAQFVDQGTVGGSPRASLYPPGDYVRAYRATFKLLGTGHEQAPAILRSFKARAKKQTDLNEPMEYIVRLGGGKLGNNAVDDRDSVDLWNFLKALQSAGPIRVEDDLGESWIGEVESTIERRVWNDPSTGERQQEARITVTRLSKPTESGIPVLTSEEGVYRYDSGITWGGDFGNSDSPAEWQ